MQCCLKYFLSCKHLLNLKPWTKSCQELLSVPSQANTEQLREGSLTKRRQIPKLLHALTALALRTPQPLPTPTPAFSPPFKGPQTGPTAAGRGLPGAGAEEDEEEGGRPYLCVPAHRPWGAAAPGCRQRLTKRGEAPEPEEGREGGAPAPQPPAPGRYLSPTAARLRPTASGGGCACAREALPWVIPPPSRRDSGEWQPLGPIAGQMRGSALLDWPAPGQGPALQLWYQHGACPRAVLCAVTETKPKQTKPN